MTVRGAGDHRCSAVTDASDVLPRVARSAGYLGLRLTALHGGDDLLVQSPALLFELRLSTAERLRGARQRLQVVIHRLIHSWQCRTAHKCDASPRL